MIKENEWQKLTLVLVQSQKAFADRRGAFSLLTAADSEGLSITWQLRVGFSVGGADGMCVAQVLDFNLNFYFLRENLIVFMIIYVKYV